METRKYRLIGGNHNQNGTTYKPGDIIESASALDKIFVGKFVRVDGVQAVKDAPPPPPAPAPTTTPQPPVDPARNLERGSNVTETFPEAVEAGFLVFRADKKFFIYASDGATDALNPEGLSRAKVAGFIADLLKE